MSEKPSKPIDTPLSPQPRAMVIGASSGIGAALARKLAEQGYQLALLARREDLLQQLCDEINAEPGTGWAQAYPHDVTDFEAVAPLFQRILKDMGRLDLVAYVSGAMPPVALGEYDFAKDRQMVDVNLLGAMAWLGQAATLFERMGAGQLLAVSSVAGDRGRVPNPGHNASKAGLTTYMEALRNRLTRHGVQVLTVKPGFVKTAMLDNAPSAMGAISPEQAAQAIWRGLKRRKQEMYVPGWWRLVMLGIIHTPSFIFRRLSL